MQRYSDFRTLCHILRRCSTWITSSTSWISALVSTPVSIVAQTPDQLSLTDIRAVYGGLKYGKAIKTIVFKAETKTYYRCIKKGISAIQGLLGPGENPVVH